MKIEKGWRFMTADFSIQAASYDKPMGSVTLVRSPDEKKKWHNLPDDVKESDDAPELYVHGHGATVEDAVVYANLKAAHAKPIII